MLKPIAKALRLVVRDTSLSAHVSRRDERRDERWRCRAFRRGKRGTERDGVVSVGGVKQSVRSSVRMARIM